MLPLLQSLICVSFLVSLLGSASAQTILYLLPLGFRGARNQQHQRKQRNKNSH